MAKSVMNGNKTGNGFDKNPQNINRKGRPRLLTSIIADLKKEGYERVDATQVQEAYEILLQLPQGKIVEYLNSFETPMFMRVVAKAMLSSKGVDMIEKMIDRAHGKAIVKADVKVETNVKQIFKIGNTEIEF